jgi:hypothetical protein
MRVLVAEEGYDTGDALTAPAVPFLSSGVVSFVSGAYTKQKSPRLIIMIMLNSRVVRCEREDPARKSAGRRLNLSRVDGRTDQFLHEI